VERRLYGSFARSAPRHLHKILVNSTSGEPMPHQKYAACIEACNSCAVACNDCAASCLKEPDVKMMTACIALDMDCAQLCALAAAMMARDSDHAGAICQVCADVCQACGDECAKHDMDHCQRCARACLACAAACRSMAAMA
jgi:hypothetical protein